MKKFLCVIVGMSIIQNVDASDIKAILGFHGTLNVPVYNMDIGEEIGVPYSTFSSSGGAGAFGWGIEASTRFLDNSKIYKPAIRAFFDNIYDTVELAVATGYDTIELTGDATHKFYGIGFDNYFQFSNNKRISGIALDNRIDEFIVIGLEYGKFDSEYEVHMSGLGTIQDNANAYGINIGYIQEGKNGLGLSILISYLFADNLALNGLFATKFGLRYTF